MTQTAAYSVDAFIDDVREIFDATQDPLAQAQGVAKNMERLLATPGWRRGWNFPTRAGTDGMASTWTKNMGTPAAVSG